MTSNEFSEPPRTSKPVSLNARRDVLAWVEIERSVLAWEEVLRGRLMLQGGQRSHRLPNRVWATLGHYETKYSDYFHPLAKELVLSEPGVIEPNARQYFPFVLPVPNTAPFQHEVQLQLPMFGPNGRGPNLKIEVAPPEACRVIATQFCTVTQMRLRSWSRTREGDVEGWFDPLGEQSLFKEAALKLFGPTHPWRGRLFLIHRSRWRWWYWDQLCLDLPNFARDPLTIREQFEGLMRQAGIRFGVADNLPLPADIRGVRAEELPLPLERRPPEPRDPSAD